MSGQNSYILPHALGRGEFARLAYRLGCARATGVLTVQVPGSRPEVLVLRRGHLMAADADALGRQASRRLGNLASLAGARYVFDEETVAYPPGAVKRQFSLAGWARSHFESQLDGQLAGALVAELTGVSLALRPDRAPDASLCDATDLRIMEALATPRRLDQIWHHARTPRFRLLSFLYFLRCVDALEEAQVSTQAPGPKDAPTPEPRPSLSAQSEARRTLGVSADADLAAIKRAYRRLARELHPDLQPDAGEPQRRALERRLADVTSAYTRLLQAKPAAG